MADRSDFSLFALLRHAGGRQWQRQWRDAQPKTAYDVIIVGAGGQIKLRGEAAAEQRLRLEMEGVKFRGKRVNMDLNEHSLRSWEILDR